MVPASIVGAWLFSLQHLFDGAHWARHVQWEPVDAALRGSSFLRLPRFLQWVTGNIGFHHVHHASPRVPNYRLEACRGAHPGFTLASVLTLAGWVARVAPLAVGRGARADGHLRRGDPLERAGSVGKCIGNDNLVTPVPVTGDAHPRVLDGCAASLYIARWWRTRSL
jgi:hypothetical protein